MIFPDRYKAAEEAVLAQFLLDPEGVHGMDHWQRVLRNGLEIVEHTPGADPEVVTAFALLHDACRTNEYDDPMHGLLGARLAKALHDQGVLPPLDVYQLGQLMGAICDHHRGLVVDPHFQPTIAACWDADRLDLPRVGTLPEPAFLSTPYAKQPAVIERVWEEAWEPA